MPNLAAGAVIHFDNFGIWPERQHDKVLRLGLHRYRIPLSRFDLDQLSIGSSCVVTRWVLVVSSDRISRVVSSDWCVIPFSLPLGRETFDSPISPHEDEMYARASYKWP